MRPLQRFISSAIRNTTRRPQLLRPYHPFFNAVPAARFQAAIRTQSTNPTIEASSTATPSKPLPHKPAPHRNPDEPIYQLTFTCKACQHRSSHTVSKQGYHKGTVLITCPGCKNRHLISDHLHIFSDSRVTIEDIMKQKGEDVQRGSITPDGDIEFWEEAATASREEDSATKRG